MSSELSEVQDTDVQDTQDAGLQLDEWMIDSVELDDYIDLAKNKVNVCRSPA